MRSEQGGIWDRGSSKRGGEAFTEPSRALCVLVRMGGSGPGIVGVIGPNGAGKTTLMKMMNGVENCDSGDMIVGETVKLVTVDQVKSAHSKDAILKKGIYNDEK